MTQVTFSHEGFSTTLEAEFERIEFEKLGDISRVMVLMTFAHGKIELVEELKRHMGPHVSTEKHSIDEDLERVVVTKGRRSV